jgi:hypothetical protein
MYLLKGRWRSCLLSVFVLTALPGCVGPSALVLTQREASDLAYQNERMRESLGERLNEIEGLGRERRLGEASYQELSAKHGELETSLRFANEQVKTLTAQRGDLKKQVEEAEISGRQFQDSLRRVQEVASASAGELAELRVRSREFEQRVEEMTQRNRSLAGQNSSMKSELSKVQAELVRQRVVVRSFREGKEVQAVFAEANRVEEKLQLENADLRGEKVALEKRIEQLEKKASTTREAAVATEGPFYQRNPAGLFGEVGTLLAARFEGIKKGVVAWDLFDTTVFGVVSVVVLAILFFLLRTVRVGRLKREVRNLRMAVSELEDGMDKDAPRPAAVRPRAEAPAPARSVRPARSSRRGFSAVISSPVTSAVEDEPAVSAVAVAGEDDGDDDPFDQLTVESDNSSGEKAPRRVIGAGVWHEDAASEPQPTRVAPVEELDEEDSMANTQIMPSFTEVELEGSGSSSDADSDDKEILTELKSVINKKFDELLK